MENPIYENKDHIEFVDDMGAIGKETSFYGGRNFWKGPAVSVANTEEFQEVASATAVRLQTDQLGKGLIVYPIASGGIKEGPYAQTS